jgi:hypothetical protein
MKETSFKARGQMSSKNARQLGNHSLAIRQAAMTRQVPGVAMPLGLLGVR